MRIFYALTFDDETKKQLSMYKDMVANHSLKGRFTREENFHLTIEFIGEVSPSNLEIYEDILYDLPLYPITITGTYIGKFSKKSKDIVWLGIERNDTLVRLVKTLKKLLVKNGLDVDPRKYSPHITLGRQVVLDVDLTTLKVPPIDIKIKSVALMISHRKNDILTYESLYEISMNS